MVQQRQSRWYSRLKLMLLAGFVATLVIFAFKFNLADLMHGSCAWIKSFGVFAPLMFMALFNIGTLLFVPGSVLTLKSGVLFGTVWGSVYVVIAATLGAILTFWLGRYCGRDWVYRQIQAHPRFKLIEAAIVHEGWKIVLLTRLSPVFPFNLTSYAFGMTQISLKDYIVGSIGILPGAIMYTYLGTVIGELSMAEVPQQLTSLEMQVLHWGMRLIGLAATIGLTVYLTQISRNALAQTAKQATSTTGSRNSDLNP
jgi:uncharacterized membrane protein YdjX (TVP38/TMEM64 family)